MQSDTALPPHLKVHQPVGAAVAALLYPHAEVVLHDLASGQVAALWNAAPGRQPGMDWLVEAELIDASDTAGVFGPYEKTGTDGRRMKSVTAVLRDADELPVGLLCINMDVSRIDDAVRLLAAFAGTPEPRPAALFAGDWREAMNDALHDWLKTQGLSLAALKRPQKVGLVAALDRKGLFRTRHAAEHLAGLVGSSRATIYNYLAEARGDAPKDR